MGDGLQKGGVLASRRFRFLAASCLYMGGFVLLHGPVLEVSLAFFFLSWPWAVFIPWRQCPLVHIFIRSIPVLMFDSMFSISIWTEVFP